MNYELLRVDRSGGVSRVQVIDVADKRAALAYASDFADNRAVEVWCSGRQIASLGTADGRFARLAS